MLVLRERCIQLAKVADLAGPFASREALRQYHLQPRGRLAEVDAVGDVQEVGQGVVAHLQPVQRCLP